MKLSDRLLQVLYRGCPDCQAIIQQALRESPTPVTDACMAYHRESERLEELLRQEIAELEADNAALRTLAYRFKLKAVSESKPRFSEDYLRHLASPEWKAFRIAAIEACGRRCQRCATPKPYAVRPRSAEDSLQVHHLHYETLGHERTEDVLVLCPACHDLADATRKAGNAAEGHLARGLASLSHAPAK